MSNRRFCCSLFLLAAWMASSSFSFASRSAFHPAAVLIHAVFLLLEGGSSLQKKLHVLRQDVRLLAAAAHSFRLFPSKSPQYGKGKKCPATPSLPYLKLATLLAAKCPIDLTVSVFHPHGDHSFDFPVFPSKSAALAHKCSAHTVHFLNGAIVSHILLSHRLRQSVRFLKE